MSPEPYDVLIVGGGMVGASLALALKDAPQRIGLVEAVAPAEAEQPSFDARAIALSEGSRRILEALGLWQALAEAGATSIRHIHVSECGGFGATRLEAAEEGVAALGQVVESRSLGQVLNASLAGQANLQRHCPARLHAVQRSPAGVEAEIDQAGERRRLQARLLVAADGGHSTVRRLCEGRLTRRAYGQSAVIATVQTDRPHRHWAYERFTEEGPLALLPLADYPGGGEGGRWSLVWTVAESRAETVLGLSDGEFLESLQRRFGRRVGRFVNTAPRRLYPLGLQYMPEYIAERLVYIGNAAHTVHPVAGQGYNLGLRDVAALAEVVARAEDPGAQPVLQAYAAWRQADYRRTLGLTDGLVRTFSNRLAGLRLGRNLGLLALEALPPMRHLLARQAMGLGGRLPRLARGLPLTGGVPGSGFRVPSSEHQT